MKTKKTFPNILPEDRLALIECIVHVSMKYKLTLNSQKNLLNEIPLSANSRDLTNYSATETTTIKYKIISNSNIHKSETK